MRERILVLRVCEGCVQAQSGYQIYMSLKEQGFIVRAADVSNRADILQKLEAGFDYVLVTGASRIAERFLRSIKESVKVVLWNADAYPPGQDKGFWQRYGECFDLVIVAVKGMVPLLEGYVKKVVWIPQYFDNGFMIPTVERLQAGKRIYDVCFVGRDLVGSIREQWLKELVKRFDVKVVGKVKDLSNECLYGSDVADLYRLSKITIDIEHFPWQAMEFKTSNRLFNVLGCGGFYLSYPVLGLDQVFEPGKHLGVYDGTFENLVGMIKFYLSHEEFREQIAKQGREEIFRNHLISKRVLEYVEAMKSI